MLPITLHDHPLHSSVAMIPNALSFQFPLFVGYLGLKVISQTATDECHSISTIKIYFNVCLMLMFGYIHDLACNAKMQKSRPVCPYAFIWICLIYQFTPDVLDYVWSFKKHFLLKDKGSAQGKFSALLQLSNTKQRRRNKSECMPKPWSKPWSRN